MVFPIRNLQARLGIIPLLAWFLHLLRRPKMTRLRPHAATSQCSNSLGVGSQLYFTILAYQCAPVRHGQPGPILQAYYSSSYGIIPQLPLRVLARGAGHSSAIVRVPELYSQKSERLSTWTSSTWALEYLSAEVPQPESQQICQALDPSYGPRSKHVRMP